jgi:hypothetical protein
MICRRSSEHKLKQLSNNTLLSKGASKALERSTDAFRLSAAFAVPGARK